jgi:hypothetical protein
VPRPKDDGVAAVRDSLDALGADWIEAWHMCHADIACQASRPRSDWTGLAIAGGPLLACVCKKRGRWIVSNFFNGLLDAYRGLPLPARIAVVMMLLAGMAVGGMILLHEVFHMDTCPLWPPNCPTPK